MKLRMGAVVAAMLVAATTLVGCSGGDEPELVDGASHEKVIEVRDQPGSVEGYVGASVDAEVTSCDMQRGALHVEGTVTNPLDHPQDYRIYVSALEDGDTVGLVQVDVPDVEGASSWSTEIGYSGDNLECVLRVERFDVQS